MKIIPKTQVQSTLSRRNFVQLMAATGATLAVTSSLRALTKPSVDDINIALIGVGKQGQVLQDILLKIPGVRFKAICDIWTRAQRIGERVCKQAGHETRTYEDYRQMLAQEKDIQAIIIATPDFWHAPITNDCLKAGMHVYCEKEMANSLEAAKSMVLTARQTGKLLQIGHQRRSNPYYLHGYNMLHKELFCGDITTVAGQWNQLKPLRASSAKLLQQNPIAPETLAKWGYGSFSEYREWRWFKKYAGGPMTDLGSHQVDILNWFLDMPPSQVTAFGDRQYALSEAKLQNLDYTPECFDMTVANYQWKTPHGFVHGIYQVNLTSSYGGFYEIFMGPKGTMVISEIPEKSVLCKEPTADPNDWEEKADKFAQGDATVMHLDLRPSTKNKSKVEQMRVLEAMNKPAHQHHLENFFNAIRGMENLNCPPEVAYATAVSVIRANESATTGKTIEFDPSEFKV